MLGGLAVGRGCKDWWGIGVDWIRVGAAGECGYRGVRERSV